MELQLGLALPSHNNYYNSSSTQIDLNPFVMNHEPKGSNPLTHNGSTSFVVSSTNIIISSKKRRFSQAFDQFDHLQQINNDREAFDSEPKTLPLLFWNDQPNDEDDYIDPDDHKDQLLLKNDDGVVGWPPIKSWRKRTKLSCHGGGRPEINFDWTVENGCGGRNIVSNFMYVKVKMEGVAIARKIDVKLHSCFRTLMDTLMDMFGKCQEDSENYKLTYQDREGDWLLADQDVPWRTFIRSVQRLKLLKRNY